MSAPIPAPASRVAGLVLAAGASSRMGRPKVALEIDGNPMLTRVLRALKEGGCAPIVVVVGPPHEALASGLAAAEGARVAHNEDPSRGMLSSLRVGLAWLEPEPDVGAVAIALVDQPRLSAGTVRSVLDAHARTGARVVRPWIATASGPRHGHPYVLGRDVWNAVIAAGDALGGMRTLLASFADSTERIEVSDAAILEDLDTPEDVAR